MTTKTVSIILVVLLVIGGLLLVALVLTASAGDAVRAALADETSSASTQHSVTVCVGLANLGCKTVQTSAVTAQRTTPERQTRTRDLLLALAGGVAVVALSAFLLLGQEES